MAALHRQLHDGVDDVVVVVLQSLHRLALRHSRLLHHQLNVLRLHSFFVNLRNVI